MFHTPFLKKLLEDVLFQNKGVNEERRKPGIQEMWIQRKEAR